MAKRIVIPGTEKLKLASKIPSYKHCGDYTVFTDNGEDTVAHDANTFDETQTPRCIGPPTLMAVYISTNERGKLDWFYSPYMTACNYNHLVMTIRQANEAGSRGTTSGDTIESCPDIIVDNQGRILEDVVFKAAQDLGIHISDAHFSLELYNDMNVHQAWKKIKRNFLDRPHR
ncbi:MAG: hypothetical protein NT001_01555 [Candidatus Woesearchaeota archaeon]|nr:hypothetical protein [Candidatus Woesearchaeota archaeon]